MKKSRYKFEYDRETDAAYLKLSDGKIVTSEEVEPGLVVDFDSEKEIVGVEILHFARRFQNATTSKSSKNRASAA